MINHLQNVGLCLGIGLLLTSVAPAAGQESHSSRNLALGAKYRLHPNPNYHLCTDPEDPVQLTDGKTTKAYFWTQQGTVGWNGVPYATVTVDLGRIEPIAGAALNTAAGAAGVLWPGAVQILVSDDGRQFRDVGDLVSLDIEAHGPLPSAYAIRRLKTEALKTRGRFVQFAIVPLAGAHYLFVDEVEVFRGPEALLTAKPGGRPVRDVTQVVEEGRLGRAIAKRLRDDAHALRQIVRDAKIEDSRRAKLLARLERALEQSRGEKVAADGCFRAVLPVTAAHRDLFAVQAALWQDCGLPPLSAWAVPTWDPLEPIQIPSPGSGSLRIDSMRGEHRAAAFCLAASGPSPAVVELALEGLPGGPTPAYLTVHQVEWTDTSHGIPVAAALPEAPRSAGHWKIEVLPGLVRQVWLTVHAQGIEGQHAGTVRIRGAGADLRLPIALKVWPLDFPKETTLRMGGWCYTDGNGSYGVHPGNRPQFLEHVKSRLVNAPWANGVVMLNARLAGDPPALELDTQRMDDWLAQWPAARQYMVFLAAGDSFLGTKAGSPAFHQRVGQWISAWVRHLRQKQIEPERLFLLVHDEPHEATDIGPLVAWARAIRAAEPKVRIWEDPTYSDPRKAPAELFAAADVLCPNRPMWLEQGKPFAQFYLDQKRQGKSLDFYSCSGPARLLDPYSYYRLQAWHCWQVGASGSFFWALGDNSGASSWNEYLAVAGPFTPLFLDKTSVVAGKQMEAMRESAEDYEYFVMLRAAVQRAKGAGRSGPALDKAEALLTTGVASVLSAPGADKIQWRDSKDRTLADCLRRAILEALTAL